METERKKGIYNITKETEEKNTTTTNKRNKGKNNNNKTNRPIKMVRPPPRLQEERRRYFIDIFRKRLGQFIFSLFCKRVGWKLRISCKRVGPKSYAAYPLVCTAHLGVMNPPQNTGLQEQTP